MNTFYQWRKPKAKNQNEMKRQKENTHWTNLKILFLKPKTKYISSLSILIYLLIIMCFFFVFSFFAIFFFTKIKNERRVANNEWRSRNIVWHQFSMNVIHKCRKLISFWIYICFIWTKQNKNKKHVNKYAKCKIIIYFHTSISMNWIHFGWHPINHEALIRRTARKYYKNYKIDEHFRSMEWWS